MKILLVSLHFVEYAVELANGLGRRNQVHLVLSKHRVHQTIGEQLDDKITNSVSYTLLSSRPLHSPSILKVICSIFKILMTFRCDVIHVQECMNPLNLFFLLFGFKPVVVTVHDVQLHPGQEASSKRSWRFWLVNKLRRCAYSKIIVHGESIRKQFINHYKRPAQDAFVVPHGCLFSFLPEKEGEIPEEPHTVLFFGRIEEYKGLKYLLEAEPLVSKRLPDFRILVAGTGDDMEAYKSILLSNRHFEVHDRFIPNKEVASFFQRASVVVLPYIEASQSGIVAMAFAFGKPVVATDVGSLAEMIEDGKTGILVPARDVKKLADAIIYLLQGKDIRKKMGDEALTAAKRTFNWSRIGPLTEQVYRKALAEKT